jgi:carboxylesterase type B
LPVVDGSFLPTSSLPLSPGSPSIPIPILAGITHSDGAPFISYPTTTNLTSILEAERFPIAPILAAPSVFPIPYNAPTTQSLFNLTARISTDAQFRCLAQSTAHIAAQNSIFEKVYAYEFDRSYQIAWSPNPPTCEAPVTPDRPFGDPRAPYYQCHSGDLMLVFGTVVSEGRVPRDEDDVPFSQFVLDTWAAFARTGNPTPDAAFLAARGFVNTTAYVARGGAWEAVGPGNDRPVRVLDVDVRSEGWREMEQCGVLGLGLEYFNTDV